MFTIEPMICEGTFRHVMWSDQWTATTQDGGRSAQFEHTLLITPNGAEPLTGRLPTSMPFFWEAADYTPTDPASIKPFVPGAAKGTGAAAKTSVARKQPAKPPPSVKGFSTSAAGGSAKSAKKGKRKK